MKSLAGGVNFMTDFNFNYEFHPVGQGLFASGGIHHKGCLDFHWVYDCGTSSKQEYLQRCIDCYRIIRCGRPELSLVVISHFDQDHISGIQTLLNNFSVDILLLPYIPLWQRLVIAFEEWINPEDNRINFYINPVEYIGRRERSPKRFLFVLPSSDGTVPMPTDEEGREKEYEGPLELNIPDIDLQEPSDVDKQALRDTATNGVTVNFLKPQKRLIIRNLWEFIPYNDQELAPKVNKKFITAVEEEVIMHDLSFDFKSPKFKYNDLTFSVNVYTFENVYTLDETKINEDKKGLEYYINACGFKYAGGQRNADGKVSVKCRDSKGFKNSSNISIQAEMSKTIRNVKLTIHGLEDCTVVNLRESDDVIVPEEGVIYTYPSGWRGLYTPLIVLKNKDNKFIFFRSLDTEVREKRFALLKDDDGLNVELIFEESGYKMKRKVTVPDWQIGVCDSLESIMQEQQNYIQNTYSLKSFETREDVPDWAREISLIASVHMQHWCGYTFNNYSDVVTKVKWLTKYIEAKRVMVYLPGWDGRYYWKYGKYEAEDTLGGEEGLKNMLKELKNLGVKTILMFGMNIVNKAIENYEQWGNSSLSTNVNGCVVDGISVDWDGSRHYRHGSNAILSPGAPAWQTRLVEEITYLNSKYGFDGIFLDIAAAWSNEVNFDTYLGVCELIKRIREENPELLITGEAWYDAMSALTPIVQSGHTEGVLHWHDKPYEDFFSKYNRQYAHLCLGDPSRGSTGVHELGYNPIIDSPIRKGIIPMVTLVEDSIESNPEGVRKIIKDAIAYADKFFIK